MDKIKKQSIYLKTLFFLFFIALGIGSPYFGIFYKHVIVNAASNYTGYFFDDVMKTPLEIGLIFGAWTLFEIPVMK